MTAAQHCSQQSSVRQLLLMPVGVAYSLGKAGRGILCRRERHFSTETVQGKRASAH